MSHAAPSASTLPGITQTRSAEALYIRELVEPRGHQRNAWNPKEVFTGAKLLWRSTRPHRVRPKRINDTNFLFYHSERLVGSFDRSVTSLVSHQARRACNSRLMQRSYLQASGIPIPEGRAFQIEHLKAATEYLQRLDTPVIVSPLSGGARQGLGAGIQTKAQLIGAWEKAAAACASLPTAQRQIMVEQGSPGLHIRLYVIGENVSATLVRLPFYVIGDGQSSLLDLVSGLYAQYEDDSYLNLPSVDDVATFLEGLGAAPEDVPSEGDIVPVSEATSALPSEAITVEVTDRVSPELKQLAVDALWAFPGLGAAGVDIRCTAIHEVEGALVANIDPAADIAEFRYPTYGPYRRLSMDIMGHMVRQAH